MKKLLLLILCLFPFAAVSQTQQEQMLVLIKEFHVGSNIGDIAARSLQYTQTYRMVVNKQGPEKAEEIFRKELDADIPKYQDEWDKNLAATYLEFYTPEEVKSILIEQKSSPYSQKYLANREKLGKSMEQKSKEVMTKLCLEVLQNTFKYIGPNS